MKRPLDHNGTTAEALAETYLKAQGLSLRIKNYHCRFGEIDLIMRDNTTLVFIEVRLRHNSQFGDAAESITRSKQQKIILTAQHYLQQTQQQVACRFDAVLLNKNDMQHIVWIKNAFEA